MQKQISTLTGIIIIVAVAVVLFSGVFAYQYFFKFQAPQDETADWKVYSDYDGITFEYPSNWIVEKEFYSTPAQQLSGEKENIGVYIYPQNRSDSVHIDGRQNSCDASENHVKCLIKEGHIIFVDSKNQKILSQFDRIVSTLENKVQNSNFETTDWKTYRNDEYGIQFQYPKNWQIESPTLMENYQKTGTVFSLGLESKDKKYYTDAGNGSLPEISPVVLVIDEAPTAKWTGFDQEYDLERQTNINGLSFYEIEDSQILYSHQFFLDISKDKKIRLLRFENRFKETDQIFKGILSTFKFTPSSEIADWKTYTNSLYGYKINYPEDVIMTGSENGKASEKSNAVYFSNPEDKGLPGYSPDVYASFLAIYVLGNAGLSARAYDCNLDVLLERSVGYVCSKDCNGPCIDIIKIGNYKAIRFSELGGGYYYILKNNNNYFELQYDSTGKRKELADQMISTFKFIP